MAQIYYLRRSTFPWAHWNLLTLLFLSMAGTGKYVGWGRWSITFPAFLFPALLFVQRQSYWRNGVTYAWRTAWQVGVVAVGGSALLTLVNFLPYYPGREQEAILWHTIAGSALPAALRATSCFLTAAFLQYIFAHALQRNYPHFSLQSTVRLSTLLAGSAALCIFPLQQGEPREIALHLRTLGCNLGYLWACFLLLILAENTIGRLVAWWKQPQESSIESFPQLPNAVHLFQLAFWWATLLTNLLATRFCAVHGFSFTAGLLPYAATFMVTDVLSEGYGSHASRQAVAGGALTMVALLVGGGLLRELPHSTCSTLSLASYHTLFAFLPGIVLSSIIAYTVSQLADVALFGWLRTRTAGRYLWLRNNLATIGSQMLDTTIFAAVLWGVWPYLDPAAGSGQLEWNAWWSLTLHEMTLKILLALADTPLVYLFLSLLRCQKREP